MIRMTCLSLTLLMIGCLDPPKLTSSQNSDMPKADMPDGMKMDMQGDTTDKNNMSNQGDMSDMADMPDEAPDMINWPSACQPKGGVTEYKVESKEDFKCIFDLTPHFQGAHTFYVTQDIEMDDLLDPLGTCRMDPESGFVCPQGSDPFRATIVGVGATRPKITGLSATQDMHVGLIHNAEDFTLENLDLTISLAGDENDQPTITGGLFVHAKNLTMKDVNITLNSDVTASIVAGGIASVVTGDVVFENVSLQTLGNITVNSSEAPKYAGGLVGVYHSNVNQTFSLKNVSLEADVRVRGTQGMDPKLGAGGLVGLLTGRGTTTITKASVNTEIEGTTNVGGLVGVMEDHTLDLSQAEFSNLGQSTVEGDTNVGGIVGELRAGSNIPFPPSPKVLDLNGLSVTGKTNVGGVAGISYVGLNDLILDDVQVKAPANTQGTFKSYGGVVGILQAIPNQAQPTMENIQANSKVDVRGTTNVGGVVGFASGLVAMNKVTSNNQSIRGTSNVGGVVGTSTGVTLTQSTSTNAMNVPRSQLSELRASGSSIIILGANSRQCFGGLVGQMTMSDLKDSDADTEISMAQNTETQAEVTNVGGLVGKATTASLTTSWSHGPLLIMKSNLGGLVGEAHKTDITNSYATRWLGGTRAVGGLVGHVLQDVTISQSYAAFDTYPVTTPSDMGGIIGVMEGAGVSVHESFFEGKLPVGGGGIIGDAKVSPSITTTTHFNLNDPSVTRCFARIPSGGTQPAPAHCQSQQRSGTGNHFLWNTNIWDFSGTFPVLLPVESRTAP